MQQEELKFKIIGAIALLVIIHVMWPVIITTLAICGAFYLCREYHQWGKRR